MLNSLFQGNPNVGFFRYSNNNNLSFINTKKLNNKNPYIGYFSQHNNKKFHKKNNFFKFEYNYLSYYKENPYIINKIIPHINTSLILFDESRNIIEDKNYLGNMAFLNYLKNQRHLISLDDSINTLRESVDYLSDTEYNDKSTQTEIINSDNIETQTEYSYESYNFNIESKLLYSSLLDDNFDNNFSNNFNNPIIKNKEVDSDEEEYVILDS